MSSSMFNASRTVRKGSGKVVVATLYRAQGCCRMMELKVWQPSSLIILYRVLRSCTVVTTKDLSMLNSVLSSANDQSLYPSLIFTHTPTGPSTGPLNRVRDIRPRSSDTLYPKRFTRVCSPPLARLRISFDRFSPVRCLCMVLEVTLLMFC